MSLTTAALRSEYSHARCNTGRMTRVSFHGTSRTFYVEEHTAAAWRLFDKVMERFDYRFRESAGGTYNCRVIGGTNRYSLHSYGLALDLNPSKNPWHTHRTDQPKAFRDAAKAIHTGNGKRVFEWGGDWALSSADPMHWEIDVSHADLRTGVHDPGHGPTTPPTTPSEEDAMLPLRKGDGSGSRAHKRWDVQALQYLLNHVFGCQLEADGKYGPAVARAVKAHLSRGSNPDRGDAVDGVEWGRLLWQAGDRDGTFPAHGPNATHSH